MMTMTRPTVKRQPPRVGFRAPFRFGRQVPWQRTHPTRLPVVVSDEDFEHEVETDAALLRRVASERML